MTDKTIKQILQEKTSEWMALPGVVGTAIGTMKGRPCIRIFTTADPDELRDQIPISVENFLVIIEETGEFHALDSE
jgi:hypothetical protein